MKRSIIWKYPNLKMDILVKNCVTFSEILTKLGVFNQGANVKTLKTRLKENKIDFSHILEGNKAKSGNRSGNRGCKFLSKKDALKQIFTNKSFKSRSVLRRYILKYNLIPHICFECGLLPLWNNKKLVLQIEHKDGIGHNHELENLGFLCPNCHSQTSTFCGKRKCYT